MWTAMNQQRLIQLLREFADIQGEDISQRLFLNLSGVPKDEITRHFRSWNDLRMAAGLAPASAPEARLTAEDVLDALRAAVRKHGPRLSLQAFTRETGISERVVFSRCGSWSKARVAVGLPPRANAAQPGSRPPKTPKRRPGPTRDEILGQLREAIREHGENITFQQFSRRTGFSGRLIIHRFGNWSDLRVAAGLSPYPKLSPRFTREDLLEDLLQVSQRTGQEPKMSYHRLNGGRISTVTIRCRFGSWEKALQALREYRQQLPPP
jgi:hypothetical protein